MTQPERWLGAKELRGLLDERSFRPSKTLGQNFVIDPNTIRKILAVAGVQTDDDVLEIGAGAGSLTLGLASRCRSVTAVEFDRALLPVLEEVLAGRDNVRVLQADALELDLATVTANKLVANLPYNIATPVVMRVLESAPQITELVVMTQKEAGERLAAPPGSKTYGVPSVLVWYFAEASVEAPVSRRAFYPVPRVDSVIVRIARRGSSPAVSFEHFAKVVRAAFSQRRKTLRNTIAGPAGSATRAEEALRAAGIDPSVRPERVAPVDFARLTETLLRD